MINELLLMGAGTA